MGKKKSDIYVCFQILPYKNKANKSIFQCKFCDRQYLQNATKMESHIITQCQKVPAAIRASYTTKPGNGGGTGSATLTGLNLSLMNKHDDLDLNDLIRDYSDSSASEAPEQMVVNVSVPAMLRIGKNAAGSSGGSSGSGRGSSNNHSPSGLTMSHGRSIQPPKSSPPAFTSLGYPSAQSLISDFNQRSMQIRAYSQLVGAGLNSMNNNNNNSNGGTNRKRARIDNQTSSNTSSNNNNNNNSINNNNYYALGGAGNPHKILIKPSHGVPAAKLPNLGNSRSNNNHSSNSNSVSATSATLSANNSAGNTAILNNRKVKPPVHVSGATITKNANLNNNNIINSSGLKEKLSREETVEIWRLLARAIYSSDVPITMLDNEHWTNVFHRIQPSLTLPSTSVLSNALVDQEYSRIGQDLEEKVEKSHFSVLECISVPGNRLNEITLVFFLTCDDSPNPYLYKTHRITDGEGYTKDILSKVIEDTILDIGLTKVVAFMSDLTPEMEGTWEILRDKFPGLLTFGCVIHGLNSILDKILTLSEVSKMLDVVKKLFTKIEKSPELKSIIEEALKGKYESPFSSEDESISNGPINSSSSSGSSNSVIFSKWKLVGKLMSQLISEKAVYQQLVGNQEAKKNLDGASSDSPGKSDRSLSNHLGSESFWTSLQSINSITVPCLQWIDSMKPNRDCSLCEVPEVFKELMTLLKTHLRNFPVDDTTKQSVQRYFLQVQRKCVNEIHFTASLLSPNQKLRGVLTEDEEAQGMEFLTYFCDSRGYHAGSILRELADYKGMSGMFATEKLWKLGQTLDVPSWWKMVQGESALSNIAISLARVVPSCSIAETNLIKANYGELIDAEKTERLAFIKYNLQMPNKPKLPKKSVVIPQPEVPKEVIPPPVVPAKIEKLRIKIPRKESTESPAIDLSARLSGCSQVSDEEEEEDDASDSDDEESSSVANSVAHNSDAARKNTEQSPPRKPDDDQTSDAEDGSTKDDSSSDSDDSSSDDQSD
ncbi:unnamed protein product [Orchesella dallaii]|uniref:DUF659 domain-containing protein n=1 Tax=Orchesella dallaii TaxID=48710 RepID=A0ABP1PJW3_9HEXA